MSLRMKQATILHKKSSICVDTQTQYFSKINVLSNVRECNSQTHMLQQYKRAVTHLLIVRSFFFCRCLPTVDHFLESAQRQHIQHPITDTSFTK